MNKQDTKKIMFFQTIWFTFLVVSLVACFFACIILGINSKNVAHAEDEVPVRSSSVATYTNDDLSNGAGYWYDTTQTLPSISSTPVANSWYSDYPSRLSLSWGTNCLSISVSGACNFVYILSYDDTLADLTLCQSFYLITRTMGNSTIGFTTYNCFRSGFEGTNSFDSTTNRMQYDTLSVNDTYIGANRVWGFGLSFSASGTLTLGFMKLEKGNRFTGYPLKSYLPYGYDAGIDSGGGSVSSPDYELISSSGVVYDNLLENNNCSAWNYQVNVQARNEELRSNRTIYTVYGSGADDEWTCTLNNASLSNYVYTPQANDSYLLWTYPSSEPFSTGSYTFTIGYSGLSSSIQHTGYYIAMQFINSQTRDEPLSVYVELDSTKWYCTVSTEITGTYDTLLLTLDSGSAYGVSGAINLGWIKLENNDYFSGYVPVDYVNYGYNEGYTKGYNLGYDEGTADSNTTYTSSIYRAIGGVQYSIQYEFPSSGGSGIVSNEEHRYFMYNGVQVGNKSWSLSSSADTHIASMSISSYQDWYTALYLGNTVGANTYYFVFNIGDNDNWSILLYDRTQSAIVSIFNVVPNVIINGYNAFAFDTNGTYEIYLTRINQASYKGEDIDLHFEDYMHIPFTTSNIYIIEGSDGAFSNGYNEGFSKGESSGYTTGYSEGYNVGAYDSGHYTFNSLLGAVFDAPITAMKGLLDFDILGTNLYGFMLALISIGLVLFILRVFLRGL